MTIRDKKSFPVAIELMERTEIKGEGFKPSNEVVLPRFKTTRQIHDLISSEGTEKVLVVNDIAIEISDYKVTDVTLLDEEANISPEDVYYYTHLTVAQEEDRKMFSEIRRAMANRGK